MTISSLPLVHLPLWPVFPEPSYWPLRQVSSLRCLRRLMPMGLGKCTRTLWVGCSSGDTLWQVGAGMVELGCGIVSGSPYTQRIQRRHTDEPVRTGQAHRTLVGHTAPVTCLQFDENHIVTGSLDKTIRVSIDTGSYRILRRVQS